MEPWGAERRLLQLQRRPLRRRRDPAADVCDRLSEVKRSWDPDDRIVANHALDLTG